MSVFRIVAVEARAETTTANNLLLYNGTQGRVLGSQPVFEPIS